MRAGKVQSRLHLQARCSIHRAKRELLSDKLLRLHGGEALKTHLHPRLRVYIPDKAARQDAGAQIKLPVKIRKAASGKIQCLPVAENSCIQLDADEVEKIELAANGALQNDLPFSVTVCMEHFSYSASFEVLDAVLDAANALGGGLPVITEDVLSQLAAWQRWKNQSSQTAAMSLSASLGPLVVNQSFSFYAGQFDGKQVYAISKDGVSIYWSGDQIVRQDGTPASAEEKELAKTSELLDVLYVTCQNAAFTKTQQAGTDVYTIQLDADGMEELAALIAPDSRKLDLTFRSGELTVQVTQGTIRRISFDCSGKVKVVSLEEARRCTAKLNL